MKRILLLFALCLFLAPAALAAEPENAPAPQKKRPKVGLVLSGGGAKGVAHIGALKIIEELGIPVDYVVGTSIGSIIGGFYALGYDSAKMDSLVRAQDWNLLMKDQVDRRKVSYSFKEDADKYLITLPFMNPRNLNDQATASGPAGKGLLRNMPGSFVEGQNLDQLFTKVSVGYQDDIDFNDLPIPFACVAVDLNTKEEVVWHSGSIVTAIRSSMSIPGYFAPVQVGDRYLVDGGMLNNLPVDVVKKMGADYVITIDLHHFKKAKEETDQTIPEMVGTMLSIMNGEKYQAGREASDIIIEPNTSAYGVLSFDDKSVNALVDSGYVAAERVLPQLRSLAEHLKTYPEEKTRRPANAIDLGRDSVRIDQLEIAGTDGREMAWLLSKTDIAPGKYITGEDMDKAMEFFYTTKAFTKVCYRVIGNAETGYGLRIEFTPERLHQAGVGFRFDSEEMASILLGISLNRHKLFGSKVDLEVELGTNPNANLNYGFTFRNLTKLNVSAQLHRMSMDVYSDISDTSLDYNYGLERTERYHYFRSELNYQITGWRAADFRLGVRYDNMDSREMSDAYYLGDHYKMQCTNAFASALFDNMNDSYFPTSGLKIKLEGGAYYGWGNYVDEEGEKIPFHSLFYEGLFDLKAAIPLGSRVTLIPQMWNRWLFGEPGMRSFYKNYVGGTMYGRYTQTQMPFIGINNTYLGGSKVDIVRADVRVNLFKQHYATLYANYLFSWYELNPDNALEHYLGLGAGYSINTIVGPVQFIVHWSNLSKRVGFHFSLGYDF